jgi:nucleolysin TIA-1/TIAR
MWDQLSGKSRGFGFVVYKEKADAEKALAGMNGQWLGSRAIRCNWANQKGQCRLEIQFTLRSMRQDHCEFVYLLINFSSLGQTATPAPIPGQVLPIEIVISQAPAYVTTVYVGNLPPNLTQEEIAPVFGQFGIVHEIKMQADRGFAFVK